MEAQTAAQKEREEQAQREAARLKAENEALRVKNELRASRTRLLTSAEGMDMVRGDLADYTVDDFNRLHDDAKARKQQRDDALAKERQKQADATKALYESRAAQLRTADPEVVIPGHLGTMDAADFATFLQAAHQVSEKRKAADQAKAAAAPDREKLLKLRADIIHFIRANFPDVTTPEAKAITAKLLKHFDDTSAWLAVQIDKLP